MNASSRVVFLLILLAQFAILTANEVDHAKKQVEHMLADRPGMAVFREADSRKAVYIDEHSAVYQLAMDVFAGKYVGERVFWNYLEPTKDIMATHNSAAFGGIYTISLSNQTGEQLDAFENMWSSFFYEAFNMSQVDSWKRVTDKAKAKLITPEEYVKECARLEWSVYPKLRKFYNSEWLDWAKKSLFHSDQKVWFGFEKKDEDNFESWYELWDDKSKYPWFPFLQQYDFFSSSTNSTEKTPRTTAHDSED
ncbi:MAG: hypothetical protein RL693_2124 [Verrucomicrobiota bacterium]|jgi:hypothetical protein